MRNLKICFITALILYGVYYLLDSIKVDYRADFKPYRPIEPVLVLNKQNLKNYLHSLPIKYPMIVYRQILLETGHLTSDLIKSHNNILGFRTSKGYIKFKHWKDCVIYYLNWQRKYYKSGDYYVFLKNKGYAEDSLYIDKLKRIKV